MVANNSLIIRVLVYGMTDSVGGIETFFMNYYRTLNHDMVSFDFLCNYSNMAFSEEIKANGDKVFQIVKRSSHPWINYQEMREFFSEHGNYDVAYMMALDLSNIDFLKYCKKANIKTRIIHSHNSSLKRNSIFKQTVSLFLHNLHKDEIRRYATDFWACSEAAARWLFSDEMLNEVVIIHNAINLELYRFNGAKRIDVRNRLNVNDRNVYGHVGRFAIQKNPLFLLDVFKEIIEIDKSAICWMIGEGSMKDEITSKIEQYGLQGKVLLLGQRKDISELMQAMDVFVFPSLFEGLSLVMIEAQASGLPIICSDSLSKEHSITDLVEYISLKKDPKEWARIAYSTAHNKKHTDTTKQLAQAGYDLQLESKKLREFLVRIRTSKSSHDNKEYGGMGYT